MKINDFFKARTLSHNQNVLNQSGGVLKTGTGKNSTAASVANSESTTDSAYNDNSSVEMNSQLNSDNSNENSLDQQQLHVRNSLAVAAANVSETASSNGDPTTDNILSSISLDGVRKRSRKTKVKNLSANMLAESLMNNLITFSNSCKLFLY
jgi:hypothetical protein